MRDVDDARALVSAVAGDGTVAARCRRVRERVTLPPDAGGGVVELEHEPGAAVGADGDEAEAVGH
jgi:hypothetical protein